MNYLLLISTLFGAIKNVEELMPTSAGKDKAAAAVAIVEGVVGDVQPILPALLSLITNLVNSLRKAGALKAKDAPAAT